MPPLRFGTKAGTLARLAPLLSRSHVLPLVSFSVAQWRTDRDALVRRIPRELGPGPLIVRSSARDEDAPGRSKAGAYLSVAGVSGADTVSLAGAVDRVIESYGREDPADQVLVQPELFDVRLSGVLFTRDLATNGPYRVFNYDPASGSTRSVTSGTGSALETYVRFRGTAEPFPGPEIDAVFAAVEEIEGLLGDRLEVELAVAADGRVVIFQVRPLAPAPAANPPSDAAVADWLAKAAKKVEKLSRPHPHLRGTRSVLGVMPDWNPAEIIGTRPRGLALTLYKEIITDSIWAYMRDNYGYRNLRSFPLLVSLLGVPYIDVRVSFNSFIPKGVRESLSEKLVNYYIKRLIEAPEAHDKVEFDIVFSCYYPGIADEISRLQDHGFTGPETGEILAALRSLTTEIVHPARGLWRTDLAKFDILESRRKEILSSPMSLVDKIYWLLEDCKRYGTLPFSGLARAAFIAIQFLKGFVSTGVFSREEHDAFLGSLETVPNRMGKGVLRLRRGEIGREEFLSSYGHLRPGTYDIRSPRYDEDFDRYFGEEPGRAPPAEGTARTRPAFVLSAAQGRRIEEMLAAEGLPIRAADLLAFMRSAIEGREYGKLVFTKSVSDALVHLEALGRQCGLSREELSHLDIRTVLGLYSTLDALDLRDIFLASIGANARSYEMTRVVRLPELIVSPADVFHFHLGPSEPNFVTQKSVTSPVVREEEIFRDSLSGKAVLVRAADPGFDWIFSRGIAAFVSQYGGANSHMAIRAAEQGIPAVIGCGERNFELWSRATWLAIDCANRTVRVVG
ncbi:MAG: phosphoenolpyruvate synthase [Planctomycetes bacterium]|nr:phosphoenolpyruvate synthase [Planctomycetota bacterium]